MIKTRSDFMKGMPLMEGRFMGRDVVFKPSCPFCGLLIEQPKEMETRMPQEMPVGGCSCGAVYAYDVTGHNLGTAMIEALVFGCDGDWDLAWGLLPEEDYQEAHVENYDIEKHLVVPGGMYEGRRIAGTLYFIRLYDDIREVTEQGARRRLERATTMSRGASSRPKRRKSFTKKEVETLVTNYRVDEVLRYAMQDKRIIRALQRLLYAVDDLSRWRAADILGRASAVIAKDSPGTISKLLQGFFTSLSDTAASSWGSLAAIGEIIKNNPRQFAGYLPELYRFLRDRALLAEVLKSLVRISEVQPDLIRDKAFHFLPLLQDPEPAVRGYTALLLGNLGASKAEKDLESLTHDTHETELYHEGFMETRTVGQLALGALEKLKDPKKSP